MNNRLGEPRIWSRFAAVAVSTLAAVAALGGAGLAASAESVASAPTVDEVTMAMGDLTINTWDPMLENPTSKRWMSLVYDWLVGMDVAGAQVDPNTGIAYEWSHNETSTEWRFLLRDDAVFHDGTPVTGEDVLWSLQRMMSPESASSYAIQIRDRISEIRLEGPNELVITTNSPIIFLDFQLSSMAGLDGIVVPRHYVEEVGADEFAVNPIGSGPYRVASFTRGDEIVLEAVEEPHFAAAVEGRPRASRFVVTQMPEESTRVAALEAGDVDITPVSFETRNRLEGDDRFRTYVHDGYALVDIRVHQAWREDSAVNDIRVREAMSISIDRTELASALFGDDAQPAYNYMPTWTRNFVARPEIPFDPDRARELLEEAGYADGLELNWYIYQRPELTSHNEVALAIAGYWDDIGISVNMIPEDYAAHVETWRADGFDDPAVAGPHPLSNRPFYDDTFAVLFNEESNLHLMYDDTMNGLIENFQNASSVEEYDAAMNAAEAYALDNWWAFPLFTTSAVYIGQAELPDWNLGRHASAFNLRDFVLRG